MTKVQQLRYDLSDENMFLIQEFQRRMAVLKRLNYIDASNAVQVKGKVAREVCESYHQYHII